MFKKFLPKNDKFFDLLNEMAATVNEGVKIFHYVIGNPDTLVENSSKIHIIENKCDDLTHTIINELNEAFVTPLDREDIYTLANVLDDVIDTIDTIVTRLGIYKLKHITSFGTQLSGIIVSQSEMIVQLVLHLQDHKNTLQTIISIRNLETEGDAVFKDALTHLFENQTDVKELIKEKEILENLEKAVDRCQRVATVMESIVIKNA